MGTQDDFAYATRFMDDFSLTSATLLWDPSFATWQQLGIRTNSSMALATADLSSVSEPWFGFSEGIQAQILAEARRQSPGLSQ